MFLPILYVVPILLQAFQCVSEDKIINLMHHFKRIIKLVNLGQYIQVHTDTCNMRL